MDDSTPENSEMPPNDDGVESLSNDSVPETTRVDRDGPSQVKGDLLIPDVDQPGRTIADNAISSAQPEFVNGQFYSLDPRNVTAETTVKIISAAVLSIGVIVGLFFVWMSLGFSWLFWSLVAGALLIMAVLFLVAYFWPQIDYRNTSFRIDRLGIEIRQGVWWRHQVSVPIGRVQHADVSQGPIQRMNGVASLTLHTAGTSNASVAIDGLAHQFAVDVRDWIVHQRKNQDAV